MAVLGRSAQTLHGICAGRSKTVPSALSPSPRTALSAPFQPIRLAVCGSLLPVVSFLFAMTTAR
jgi:hypothetical protein